MRRRPWYLAILVGAALLVVLAAVRLAAIEPSQVPSVEQLVDASVMEELHRSRAHFDVAEGSLTVMVETTTPQELSDRVETIEARLGELDGVQRTWSWLSRPRLALGHGDPPRLELVHGPAPDGSSTAFDELLRPSDTTAIIVAELAPGTTTLDGSRALAAELQRMLDDVDGPRPVALGPPILRAASWQQVRDDLGLLVPILVVVAVAVPWIVFRSPLACVFPLVLAGFTAALSTAAFALVEGAVTPLIVILLPLWWAVATLDALHLYQRAASASDPESIGPAVRSAFWPCLATTVTTAASLLALGVLGHSPLLATFGRWGALGTAVAFMATFAVGGAFLRIAPLTRAPRARDPWMPRIVRWASRHRGWVIGAWLLAVGVGALRWSEIQPQVRYPGIFVEDHPQRVAAQRTQDALGTDLLPIEIYLEPVSDRYRAPAQSTSAAIRVADYLQTLPETRHVLGASALTLELLRDDPAARNVLARAAVRSDVDEMLGPLIDDPAARSWIDLKTGHARLQLHLTETSVARRREILEWIRHFDETNLDGYRIVVGGPGVLYPAAETDALSGLRAGAIATLVILTLGFFAILPWRRVPVALVVNAVPIGLAAGIMGWMAIPWTMGLLAVPVVLAGLSVDDTIHLMWGLRRTGPDRPAVTSVEEAATHTGPALLATTLVLGGSFGGLMVSRIAVNRELGLLFAIGIAAALLCDLTLLPALVGRRGKPPES